MVTYVIGIVLIIGLFLAGPLLLKVLHTRTLKAMRIDGVERVPRFFGLDGLRYRRPAWQADVAFEAPALGRAGRGGHLRFTARPAAPVPLLEIFDRAQVKEEALKDLLPLGEDRVVAGDRAYADRLLTPETRERLARIDALGGRVWALGASVDITGPLLKSGPELKEFLDACEAIVDRTLAAAKA